jgi:hypothetical protein
VVLCVQGVEQNLVPPRRTDGGKRADQASTEVKRRLRTWKCNVVGVSDVKRVLELELEGRQLSLRHDRAQPPQPGYQMPLGTTAARTLFFKFSLHSRRSVLESRRCGAAHRLGAGSTHDVSCSWLPGIADGGSDDAGANSPPYGSKGAGTRVWRSRSRKALLPFANLEKGPKAASW